MPVHAFAVASYRNKTDSKYFMKAEYSLPPPRRLCFCQSLSVCLSVC